MTRNRVNKDMIADTSLVHEKTDVEMHIRKERETDRNTDREIQLAKAHTHSDLIKLVNQVVEEVGDF